MRDSKGRFTKPAPRAFQINDRVRRKNPGTDGVPAGTLGTVSEIGPDRLAVKWDNGFAKGILRDGDSYGLESQQKYLELVEPAPQPKAEELLAAIRAATGVPYSEGPNLVTVVSDIARQMDRHRWERDAARQEIATLKSLLERTAKALHEEMGRGADIESARLVLLRKVADAEAKLSDAQAIVRVMEIAKASENPDWDFTTLMAQVIKEPAA